MATSKKVTEVGRSETTSVSSNQGKGFVPTAEAKGKATQLRVLAAVFWILAVIAQLGAIWHLLHIPESGVIMWLVILLIAVDLALAITGSMFWKKSNRFDPASEKKKFLFFLQNQLGIFTAIVAFLPLVIVIFRSNNLSGKQKGILGGIAIAALAAAGLLGADFNPPSQEQYAEQTAQVESLTGNNHVYWTKSGTKYHIYDDCQHINTNKTDEIFSGTVANAREEKNITELCKTCATRAEKAKGQDPVNAEETLPDSPTE
ncbi:MAG: hypothetical protein LBR51_01460 [Bacteroidales bacterium]|jgi:hypothetical protein|nr:hypothetical protein [Bacteroidales bacterium]